MLTASSKLNLQVFATVESVSTEFRRLRRLNRRSEESLYALSGRFATMGFPISPLTLRAILQYYTMWNP
jgi:hypothetical protein